MRQKGKLCWEVWNTSTEWWQLFVNGNFFCLRENFTCCGFLSFFSAYKTNQKLSRAPKIVSDLISLEITSVCAFSWVTWIYLARIWERAITFIFATPKTCIPHKAAHPCWICGDWNPRVPVPVYDSPTRSRAGSAWAAPASQEEPGLTVTSRSCEAMLVDTHSRGFGAKSRSLESQLSKM